MDVLERTQLDAGPAELKSDAELPFSLELELTVKDHDSIAELCRYPEGDSRDEFALIALRIGMLALRQARGQIDADVVRREAERMLFELSKHLGNHAKEVEGQVATTLKHYFDPTTGRLSERIENLIKCDGDLERVIRAQVGSTDSELCKTLAAHIGENSPLMKMLSPTERDGLLDRLTRIVEKELKAQSEGILKEFSLNNEESALVRFLNQINEKHEKVGKSLSEKVNEVIKEFSLNDEESFFSQLQRTLDKTSKAIDSNLTLDDEKSSLARLKREVLKVLEEQGKANEDFREQVKITIAQITARKKEADASTRHGLVFEDAVAEFLQRQAQQRGDVFDRTSARVGQIKNCKIGDFTWELGPDTASPGGKIVIEAKEDQSCTLADARKEISQARDNRGAQVGLFIFSRRTAPENSECLRRIGENVFLIWDAENPDTDCWLNAGLELSRAICFKTCMQTAAQQADFGAIDAVILDIEKKAATLEEVVKSAETIRSHADKIIDRAGKAREGIDRQVENLQGRIVDLKESVATQSQ